MLCIDDLAAGYGGLEVLHGVSLTVPERSICSVIGANGAGKTTLLRAISGRIHVRHGSIVLSGHDITQLAPHVRARLGVCHVAEGGGIFPSLTVVENLRLFGASRAAVADVLDIFPRLANRLGQRAGSLSGGEQQMLALARAWAAPPGLVLIDECSLGIAAALLDDLIGLIAQLPDRGCAVLLVEQHLDLALGVADTAVLLQRGEVVGSGSKDALDHASIEACLLGATPAAVR